MTCHFSSAHEMGKQPHPFQDLTLDGNGRPSWLAHLGYSTSKEPTFDAGKATLGDPFLMVFDGFACFLLPIDVGKLETNT